MNPHRSESDVLSSVMALLRARGIFHLRMQSGAAVGEHKGKRRLIRFGAPGMADVLAFPRFKIGIEVHPVPVWIEVKGSEGRQSKQQHLFDRMVMQQGHYYLLVRSAAELENWLRENLA